MVTLKQYALMSLSVLFVAGFWAHAHDPAPIKIRFAVSHQISCSRFLTTDPSQQGRLLLKLSQFQSTTTIQSAFVVGGSSNAAVEWRRKLGHYQSAQRQFDARLDSAPIGTLEIEKVGPKEVKITFPLPRADTNEGKLSFNASLEGGAFEDLVAGSKDIRIVPSRMGQDLLLTFFFAHAVERHTSNLVRYSQGLLSDFPRGTTLGQLKIEPDRQLVTQGSADLHWQIQGAGLSFGEEVGGFFVTIPLVLPQ